MPSSKRSLFPAILFLFFSFSLIAQPKLINSGEVIERGKALYDSGKYAEAILLYKTIPERDTNYMYMLTELALTYFAAEKFDSAIATADLALKTPSYQNSHLLKTQGMALEQKQEFDKAIAHFENILKKYPAFYSALYSLGITYYNKKDYEKATEIFFKVLEINPYHGGSHLNLGRLSAFQGNKAHALLSFGIYLSIANGDNERLVFINNLVDNQFKEEGSIPSKDLNDLKKLDQIIRSKVAMEENFKSRFPMTAPIVRQFELLFGQLDGINKNSQDKWIKFYLPIYQSLKDKDQIEPFVYHLLASTSIEAVKKWRSKNEKVLDAYFDIMNASFRAKREYVFLPASGITEKVQAHYDDDNNIDALGNMNGDKKVGVWRYYYDNYELSAEGNYNDEGSKTGIWKYYFSSGRLKGVENYATNEVTNYNEDGSKIEHFFLKDDKIHGKVEIFYPCGQLNEVVEFKDGKRHGKGEDYFVTGERRSTYQYKEGELDGKLTYFFPDGKLERSMNYVNGKLDGEFKAYHSNGKLKSEGKYAAGVAIGDWKYYYSNGQLEQVNIFDAKGDPSGKWTFFNRKGVLTEERPFGEEGKRHGDNVIYYDGIKHYVITYKKGKIIQSIFYDKKGNVLGRNGNDKGNFTCKNYHINGKLMSEGTYKDGQVHGLWKYYNRYGVLTVEKNYLNSNYEGKTTEYYPSGQKQSEAIYVNDQLHGLYRYYFENGQVAREGWYLNDKAEQQWLTYYRNGTLESDSYFLFDQRTGATYNYSLEGKLTNVTQNDKHGIKDITYYNAAGLVGSLKQNSNGTRQISLTHPNGKPKFQLSLKCGYVDGIVNLYFPDGTPQYSYGNKRGNWDGPYTSYNPAGVEITKGQYESGQRAGYWVFRDELGSKTSEGIYVDGEQDSIWTYYHPNGKCSSRLPNTGGLAHGIGSYYTPEGTHFLDKLFEFDNLVAYRSVVNGQAGEWVEFDGSGTITINFANGKPALIEEWKNGYRHGIRKQFYENGNLLESHQYKFGEFDGPYVEYHANGKVKEKGTFVQGFMDGVVECFREDGTPALTIGMNSGERNGKTIVYDKTGKKIKEYVYWDGLAEF